MSTDSLNRSSAPEAVVVSRPSFAATKREAAVQAVGRAIAPIIAFIIIVLLWHYIVVWTDTKSFIVPRPGEVLSAGVDNASLLWQSTMRTARAAATGFLAAVVIGIVSAIVLHSSRLIERSLLPYAVLLQTTPIVAIAPLIVIWIGAGLQSIATIAFIISFFPMLSNTLVGLHSVDSERLNLFRILHATRFERLTKLELPTALPFILAGARISAGLSVIGAIVGEFVAGIGGGRGGLGYVITVSARQLDTAYLFASAFAGSLLGITFYAVIGLITRWLLGSWHESQTARAEQRPSG